MKIKNNTKANMQFNVRVNAGQTIESVNQFGNTVLTPAKPEIKLVHIPSNATVIIDDSLYEALMAAKTPVHDFEDIVEEVENADILMGKDKLKIKSRLQSGESHEISIFETYIQNGDLVIYHEKPVVEPTMEEMRELLSTKGITLAEGMSSSQIKDLYKKLK